MAVQATDPLTASVAQAADLLGVGRGSLYAAVRDGRVPALRVGRKPRLRIPRRAIDRLLERPERWQGLLAEEPEAKEVER